MNKNKSLFVLIIITSVFILLNFSLLIHLKFFSRFKIEYDYLKLDLRGFFEDQILKFIFQTNYVSTYDHRLNEYDIDSIHLQLKIDFNKSIVQGRERITFRFINESKNFTSNQKCKYLILHCGRNLKIKKIRLQIDKDLYYYRKGEFLFVRLINEEFPQSYTIFIDYEFKASKDLNYKGFVFDKLNNHFYTLSEPYFGRYWYVTKEIPSDKFIFSSDIILPDTLFAVSNGILVDSLSLGNGYKKFAYRSKYPVSHYLIFVAGGNYRIFEHTYHYSEKNLKFQHLLFPETYELAKDDLYLLENMYESLSMFLDEYPFIDELYGVVEVSWPYGGMEHQTRSAITTLGFARFYPDISLQAHEFAHHWFGNSVTCKTFNDIWLNEGFATFAEEVAFIDDVNQIDKEIELQDMPYYHGRVYAPQGFIFSRTVYDKGAWILKMLMHEVGVNTFIKILRTYLKEYEYSSASTEDFINVVNKFTKKDYRSFFNQWLYYRNDKPNFKIEYNSYKKDKNYICIVKLSQIQPKEKYKGTYLITLYYENDTEEEFRISLDERDRIFIFERDEKLRLVGIDRYNENLDRNNLVLNENLKF